MDTGFPILADPFDTESVATGMVLATLQLDRERTRTRERERERKRLREGEEGEMKGIARSLQPRRFIWNLMAWTFGR